MLRSGGGSLRYRRYTRRMIRAGWRPSTHITERMRSGGTINVMNFVSLEDAYKEDRILGLFKGTNMKIKPYNECHRCKDTSIKITNDGSKYRLCGECDVIFYSEVIDITLKCPKCGSKDKLPSGDDYINVKCYDCDYVFNNSGKKSCKNRFCTIM